MSREKQIDQKQVVQMARDICCKRDKPENCKDCDVMWCKAHLHAFRAYKAGYRKQSEGEWVERIEPLTWCEDDVDVFYECSCCGTQSHGQLPYCPSCGAKMKGE